MTVDEDGKTRIHEKYVVSAPLVGRLLRINMEAGDPVEAGKTLLAMIEPRDPDLLDARTVAQAEASVKAAEATLKKMEPLFEEARAAQSFAESELARARKAAAGNAISKSELENAEYVSRKRVRNCAQRESKEEIARFELEQAKAALLRTRPQDEQPGDGTTNGNGGWTFTIYSPINGRVLRVLQESAAVVNAGTPLLELGDPLDLEVEIDVLSRDAVKIHPGAACCWNIGAATSRCKAECGSSSLPGSRRFQRSASRSSASTPSSISSTRRKHAKRWATGFASRPGSSSTKRMTCSKCPPVHCSVSANSRPCSKWWTASFTSRCQDRTPKRPGGRSLDGLAAGDQVVLHPSDQIEDGVRVRQR